MSKLDDALALAADGWPVFPCEGKVPLTKHGFKDATTDPEQVQALWSGRKGANVGVALPDGLWIADVDRAEALPSGLDLPALQETPSGGFHAGPYLVGSERLRQGSRPWGDVKVGGKGYVIAWHPEHWPKLADVGATPPAVAELAQQQTSDPPEGDDVETFADGERNGGLTRLAGGWRPFMHPNELHVLLQKANEDRCHPPLPRDEVTGIALSAAKWKMAPNIPVHAVSSSPDTASRFEIMSARDLLVNEYPRLEFVVPGIIPEGTSLLVSPPKIGKSSLVVQIVVALRMGGTVLGRQVEVRDALYLALEDGKRRMQSRLVAHLAPYKGALSQMRDLGVVLDAPRIGDGLEDMLGAWYEDHPRGAVFVDTLQIVRPVSSGRRNVYEVDVEDFRKLRATMSSPSASLTVVHHVNKANNADDFLTAVSGSHGLAGTADTTIRIKRDRHDAEGEIEVTGRDVPELELPVRYEDLIWSLSDRPLLNAAASERQSEIAKWLQENGPSSPAVVARGIGQDRSNVNHCMVDMFERGQLARPFRGVYDVLVPVNRGKGSAAADGVDR